MGETYFQFQETDSEMSPWSNNHRTCLSTCGSWLRMPPASSLCFPMREEKPRTIQIALVCNQESATWECKNNIKLKAANKYPQGYQEILLYSSFSMCYETWKTSKFLAIIHFYMAILSSYVSLSLSKRFLTCQADFNQIFLQRWSTQVPLTIACL